MTRFLVGLLFSTQVLTVAAVTCSAKDRNGGTITVQEGLDNTVECACGDHQKSGSMKVYNACQESGARSGGNTLKKANALIVFSPGKITEEYQKCTKWGFSFRKGGVYCRKSKTKTRTYDNECHQCRCTCLSKNAIFDDDYMLGDIKCPGVCGGNGMCGASGAGRMAGALIHDACQAYLRKGGGLWGLTDDGCNDDVDITNGMARAAGSCKANLNPAHWLGRRNLLAKGQALDEDDDSDEELEPEEQDGHGDEN